jgi:hypothetical protein
MKLCSIFIFVLFAAVSQADQCDPNTCTSLEVKAYDNLLEQIKKTPRIYFTNSRSAYVGWKLDDKIKSAASVLGARFGENDVMVVALNSIFTNCRWSIYPDVAGDIHGSGREASCVNGVVNTNRQILESRVCNAN